MLCCDGVWDVVSNEECVAEIRKRASSGNTLAEITDGLLDKCLELGSRDNMTACLIQLQLPA